MSKDKIFNDNLGLAFKLAVSFSKKGSKNSLTVDDLFQESKIGLVSAIESYNDDKGKFGTYAYRVIKNHLLKLFETKKVSLEEEEVIIESFQLVGIAFDELACFNNNHLIEDEYLIGQIVNKMNEVLTFDEKECVLDYIHGINDREIGEMYGVTQQNISVRRTKAIKKLQEAINPSSFEVAI